MSPSENLESQIERLVEEYLTRIDNGEEIDLEEFAAQHGVMKTPIEVGVTRAWRLQEIITHIEAKLDADAEFDLVTAIGAFPEFEAELTDHYEGDLLAKALCQPVADCTTTRLQIEDSKEDIEHTFDIKERLGAGTYGEVFRAIWRRRNREDTEVALKRMRIDQQGNLQARDRFLREGIVLHKMKHDNVVQIEWSGIRGGCLYLAMHHVNGGSLRDQLEKSRPIPKQAARIVRDAALGIYHAHQRGILHRDIKPGNLLIQLTTASNAKSTRTPFERIERVVVSDFGMAKAMEQSHSVGSHNVVVGTLSYMAPEQANPTEETTASSDIFGLGAVLYELLVGRPPYTGNRAAAQVLACRFDPPRSCEPSVSVDLETICLRCLQANPTSRYRTAMDLAEDLQRFIDDKPIVARNPTVLEAYWNWKKTNPTAANLAAGLIIFIVLAIPVLGALFIKERATARRELQQRRLAESAFEMTSLTVSDVLGAVQQELRESPYADVVQESVCDIIADRLDTVASIFSDEDQSLIRGMLLTSQSQVEHYRGHIDQAFILQEHSIAELEKLSGYNRYRHEGSLAVAYHWLSELFRTRQQLPEAREALSTARALSEREYKRDPTPDALGRLGKVVIRQLNLTMLQKGTTENHARFLEELVGDSNFTELSLRARLSFYEALGDASFSCGELEAALQWYKQQLHLCQLWREQRPGLARDASLAIAYERMAKVAREQTGAKATIEWHNKQVELWSNMLAHDACNLRAMSSLSRAYDKLGTMHVEARIDGAKVFFDRAIAMQRSIVDRSPANQNEKFKLLALVGNVGQMYYQHGDFKLALDYFDSALKIRDDIPGDDLRLLYADVFLSTKKGATYLRQGDLDAAEQWFLRALELIEAYEADHVEVIEDVEFKVKKSIAFQGAGNLAGTRGDRREKQRLFECARVVLESLPPEAMQRRSIRHTLGVIYEQLSDCTSSNEEQTRFASRCLELYQSVDLQERTARTVMGVASAHQRLALSAQNQGRFGVAIQEINNAIDLIETLSAENTAAVLKSWLEDFAEHRQELVASESVFERPDDALELAPGIAAKVLISRARFFSRQNNPAEVIKTAQTLEHIANDVIASKRPEMWYAVARMYGTATNLLAASVLDDNASLAEAKESALDSLENAIAAGFSDVQGIESLEEFDLLRQMPRLRSMIDALRSNSVTPP